MASNKNKTRPVDVAPKLPSDIGAELAVLGTIMLENACLSSIIDLLAPEHFFLPQHRTMFRAMLELHDQGQPIDSVMLFQHLDSHDLLEAAGGVGYFTNVDKDLPRAANVRHYAEIVRKKANLRELASVTLALHERTLDQTTKDGELCALKGRIDAIFDAPTEMHDGLQVPDAPLTILDGRLGEICIRRLAGFPIAYSWVSLVTVAGTLVPASGVRTNLFTGLVGPVGSGKTQVIDRCVRIMGLARPLLETTLAGSAEGLLEKLSDADGDARLLSPDELAHLLTKAKIDNASFPFVLNTAYSATEFEVTMQRGKKVHVNVRLGIIGGVVDENFQHCFGLPTTHGLYDRFIFAQCPQPHEFVYRPFEGGPEDLEPCPVKIAPEVWEEVREWKDRDPNLTGRIIENSIRVACIVAAFDGRSILEPRFLAPAHAFAEYQSRIRNLLKANPGETLDARCAYAIRTELERRPGWIKRHDLARRIHAERYGPNAFERALRGLAATGDIDLPNGRPALVRLRAEH